MQAELDRLKHDISIVGALLDGTPVYRFKYAGSDAWRIGLMARDVELIKPQAITVVNGEKSIDYGSATQDSLVYEAH